MKIPKPKSDVSWEWPLLTVVALVVAAIVCAGYLVVMTFWGQLFKQ